MIALRTALATAASSILLLHCATPSSSLERAQQLRRDTPAQYAEKQNTLQRDQAMEQAALERDQSVERAGLTKEYREETANDVLRVSDARARLYEDYVKVLAASNARLSNFKSRLEAVQRRDDARTARMVDKVAAARTFTSAAQTQLNDAGERTTAQWDSFKVSLDKKLDAAEKSVSEAERSVAMR
jgi:hypothetical protein